MHKELPRASVRVGLSVAGYHGCALIVGIYLLVNQSASFGMTAPLPSIILPQLYAAVIWAAGGWLPALLVPATVQKQHWWICVVLGIFQTPVALIADNLGFPSEHLLPSASDALFIRILGWGAFYSGTSYLIYTLGFVLLAGEKTSAPVVSDPEFISSSLCGAKTEDADSLRE